MHNTRIAFDMELQPHHIQRLPPELLAKIFLHSSLPNRPLSKVSQRYRVMLPSHVCQRWRDITVSTPILWSFILFSVENDSEACTELEIDCARAWLARAKQCALSVAICIRPFVRFEQLAVATALDLFIPHCTRWRELIFTPVPREFGVLHRMCADIRGNVPMLEAFEISYCSRPSMYRLNLFEIAPKCRRLKLHGFMGRLLVLAWDQITHFQMNSYLAVDTLDILTLAPNLVQLTGVYNPIHIHDPPRSNMTHWHLSTLHLYCNNKNSTSNILGHLTLPHLSDLAVEWMVVTDILSLLSRSACILTKFHAHMHESNTHELTELLQRTPEIQELWLGFGTVVEWKAILKVLNLSPVQLDHPLAPKLRSLTLRSLIVPGDCDLDLAEFAELVSTRWRYGAEACSRFPQPSNLGVQGRIEIARLELEHRPGADLAPVAIARLREFAAEGLDIDITLVAEDTEYESLLRS